jgi:beta-barrel assembly-enhancing protease
MEKTLAQGLVIVVVFFVAYVGLQQIDWMSLFNVEENTKKTEEKLGELFWEAYKEAEIDDADKFIYKTIDSLLTEICKANNIDRTKIKLHILQKDEVNAFALPGSHLVIYSGLISDCDNQEELTGVIGHELAHIQLDHVMNKLVKEIGLGTLVGMTTGNGSPEIIVSTARMLSSTAFDRKYEKEADLKSVDYMIKARLNPEPFSDFLYRMSSMGDEVSQYLTWISTHPESKERATYIVEYLTGKEIDDDKIIDDSTWVSLKERINDSKSKASE